MEQCSDRFLAFSRKKLTGELWPRLAGCLEQLSDEQVWWRPNEASNSIGNLLLHLNGNVRQWIVGALGNDAQARDRDAEFAQREQVERSALTSALDETLKRAGEIISGLTEADLARNHTVQGYEVSGLDVVYHVVEHFAMHYGQIVYLVKMLQDRDLGFYSHLSQRSKRQEA